MNHCTARTCPALFSMLILASQSPSRHLLLNRILGKNFQAYPADIDETPIAKEIPTAYVTRVAREKAEKVSLTHGDHPILAADTIVAVGRRILRKAESEQEAYQQLDLISGRRHRSYTAVVLRLPSGAYYTRLALTHVSIKILEPHEKDHFIRSQEWKTVAVYKIDGIMGMYVRAMRGLPSTVQGLPLWDTYGLLKSHGLIPNALFESMHPSTA
jgi:septum formation protein